MGVSRVPKKFGHQAHQGYKAEPRKSKGPFHIPKTIGPLYTNGVGCSPESMGVATDFKVGGVQNRIRELSERRKFFVPHFSKCGGTSKQISIGTY